MPRHFGARLALSVVGLGVVVAAVVGVGHVHPSEIATGLGKIGVRAALLATAAVVAQMLLILTRLWFLLPSPRPPWRRVAYAFSLGQVVNNFLPVRSGDVVKAMIISREPGERRFAEILGVMIADSLIDMTALAMLVACVGPGELVAIGSGWGRLVTIAIVIGAAAFVVYTLRRNAKVQPVLRGMRVLRDPRRLAGGLVFSTGNWTTEVIALNVLTAELGGSLGFADAIRVLFLFNLAIVIPLSIANVGTFEAPIAFGLRAAGLTFATGLAVGTAYHGLQIVGILLLAATMLVARHVVPRFA